MEGVGTPFFSILSDVFFALRFSLVFFCFFSGPSTFDARSDDAFDAWGEAAGGAGGVAFFCLRLFCCFLLFFTDNRTRPETKEKEKKKRTDMDRLFFCQPIRDDVGGPVAQSSQTFVLKTNEGEEEQDRKIESPFQNK